jgi:hypothetical protein
LEEPADLKFSVRPDVRPQRKSSSQSTFHWWLLLALGALVFLLVRGLLARGAETTGHSEQASSETLLPSSEEFVDEVRDDPTPTVYKCVGKGGAVSFQSFPCAADEAMRGAYAARPETRRDMEIAQEKQRDAARQAQVMSRMAGTDRPASTVAWSSNFDEERARCEAAKAHREQTLRQVGLARTYELLQRLDEIVREACKGQ